MTTAQEVARPKRDRPTWVSYSQLGVYAYLLYTFGVAITFLRDEEGISRQIASLHGTALAIGAIVGAAITPALTRRFGRGPILRLAAIGMFVGVLLNVSGLGFVATMLGTFIYAAFGFLGIVGINAFLPEYQGAAAAPAAISESNVIASIGGLIGPIAVGIVVWLGWGWRPAAIAALFALIGLELWRGRNTEVYDAQTGHPEDQPGHDPGGRFPRGFWMYLIVAALVVGSEFVLVYFATDFLRDQGGLGDAAAAASVATIAGGMLIGRFIGSQAVERVNPEWALQAALGLMLVSFLVAWFATNTVVLLIAMTLSGIGLGPLWPLAVTRSVLSSGGLSDRASSRTAIAAMASTAVLPFIVATIADRYGIHLAMLAIPIMLVLSIFFVFAHPLSPQDQPHPADQ